MIIWLLLCIKLKIVLKHYFYKLAHYKYPIEKIYIPPMIKSPEEEKVIAELLRIEERIPANLPEVPKILTEVSRNIVKLD